MAFPGHKFTPTERHDTYPFMNPGNLDLTGKYIAITGASKGIGKAIALSYAKAGVSGMALLARSDLSETRSAVLNASTFHSRAEPQIITIKADVTNRHDCEAAANQIKQEFPKLDILINNAGVLEKYTPIADSDPDEWWNTFEVNVKGIYLMTRSFIPLLLSNPSSDKTIIQISSAAAIATTPGGSAYQTSKTTVCRLNDFVMAEYGSQGLLAYAVHPGGVPTDLSRNLPVKMQEVVTIDTAELPGDSIAWLTSERREWLGDRYVSVQWDMEELVGMKDQIEEGDLLKLRIRV